MTRRRRPRPTTPPTVPRSSCESWDEALAELRQAAAADARFAVWPATKYQVERILARGRSASRSSAVTPTWIVASSSRPSRRPGIDRDVATIFREARILRRPAEHPGSSTCTTAGSPTRSGKQRPYLEIAHFADSLTLEDHVRQHGPLTLDDLLPVAVQTAERSRRPMRRASGTATSSRPTCSSARRRGAGRSRSSTSACRCGAAWSRTSQARAAGLDRSMIGSAVAGTLHYAAPEQLDPDRSREVGPHSDVFGFGRTCYFALFGEPYPDQEDLDTLPQPWKDFLGRLHGEEDRPPTEGLRRRAGAARGHPGAASDRRGADGPPIIGVRGLRHVRPRRRCEPQPAAKTTPKTAPCPGSSTPWA